MEKEHIFDNPKNIKLLLRIFFCVLVLLLAIDLFTHKDAHFVWEKWPAFYSMFGFVACVCLVLIAKYILRPLVKRDEDYYD